MNITINPFQQLYFSDDAQTENNFVELFSEQVLQAAIHPIFQGGNVVLSGTQGCGKTMILNLLRPELRIAYHKADKDFPVNERMCNFISAGINLTRSRITDIAQVTLHRGVEADEREMPLYFADFFNYLVVDDLINSVSLIGDNPDIFNSTVKPLHLDHFVHLLVRQKCWFEYFVGVNTLDELKSRIGLRLDFYRRWINGNLHSLQPPESIRSTKTNIGEPIARTAECLKLAGVVSSEIPILIRVDQIEELHRAFTDRQRNLLLAFRKMINRVFASRDARVHYRAGTRRYGWNRPEFLAVWGSDARLENRRDYQLIEMDEELFAWGETRNSVFERFALDAFQKRVAYYYQIKHSDLKPQLAKLVFGKNPSAAQRLRSLNPKSTDSQVDRALGLDLAIERGKWTDTWKSFLRKLYRTGTTGMLDAVLAAAWGRQTGGAHSKKEHRSSPPPKAMPWRDRKWWRKERLDQAVLQLMTRRQQRLLWWGFDDIRSLSGGNITIFLHICHRIWDAFLKNESSLPIEKRTEILTGEGIDQNIQAAAILFASNEWYNKLPEEPGGNSRQSFVQVLGARLNEDMMRDLRMSYPGGNGISIAVSEFSKPTKNVTLLQNFIRDSIGYGVLFETEHSSKSKAGGRRTKMYLTPILCPRFQLPEARTKEPYYLTLLDLYEILRKAEVTLDRMEVRSAKRTENLPLFPDFGGSNV